MKAEIRGKISSSGSNLHDRLEDQLTGDVFGACRYVRLELLLWPLLEQAYYGTSANCLKLNHPRLVGDLHFWPWLVEAEPDVVIDVQEADNTRTAIVIEAKLDSGLSSQDQLLREMRGLAAKRPGCRLILIFLTAEVSYPDSTMNWTQEQADKHGLSSVELYWLSWHDFPVILEQSMSKATKGSPEWFVFQDLTELLARKEFARFTSMKLPSIKTPTPFATNFHNVLPDMSAIAVTSYRLNLTTALPTPPHYFGGLQCQARS